MRQSETEAETEIEQERKQKEERSTRKERESQIAQAKKAMKTPDQCRSLCEPLVTNGTPLSIVLCLQEARRWPTIGQTCPFISSSRTPISCHEDQDTNQDLKMKISADRTDKDTTQMAEVGNVSGRDRRVNYAEDYLCRNISGHTR